LVAVSSRLPRRLAGRGFRVGAMERAALSAERGGALRLTLGRGGMSTRAE